jgi:hypothetical protein
MGLILNHCKTISGAWALSRVVAFPTLLAVLPLVRRVVSLVVATPAKAN